MISMVNDVIDKDDIDLLIEWLKTYPRLTKGPLTEQFEQEWAKYIGTKYAVFVNSGSSANLIALAALIETRKLEKGDKVVVPALAWATDLAPVIQLGLEPILCDCNREDLSIDVECFKDIISNQDIKALMLVEVLGFPPNRLQGILNLCKLSDVIIIEDVCESLGAAYEGKMLGSFGEMSTFSTYFGHHISTIEGGMVCTDSGGLYNILKSLRSHGWGRDLDKTLHISLKDLYGVSDFKDMFSFYYNGFNLRSTDLQAFIGLNQLKKLPDIVARRRLNYEAYSTRIINHYWKPSVKNLNSNFAYPIIHPNKDAIVKELQKNQVDTRPLIAGSLAKQPCWRRQFSGLDFEFAEIVDKYGIYVPNHPDLTYEEISFICKLINKHTT